MRNIQSRGIYCVLQTTPIGLRLQLTHKYMGVFLLDGYLVQFLENNAEPRTK